MTIKAEGGSPDWWQGGQNTQYKAKWRHWGALTGENK